MPRQADPDWLYEMKFDGYRLLARLDHGEVRLYTRNGHDWAPKLPHLVAALRRMPLETAWLDGEIVMLADHGAPSFQALQNAFDGERPGAILFYAFDLPYVPGRDPRGAAGGGGQAGRIGGLPLGRHGRIHLRSGARQLLLPGGQYPPAGGAPGDRGGDRAGPDRMHAARGGGRAAGPGRDVARAARRVDRGAAVRRGPAAPLPAVPRRADPGAFPGRRAARWLGRDGHRGAGGLRPDACPTRP
ncbi:hypothetical protein AYO32_11010 [Streptococcus pneumoniae]|nr:hypothetical protein AYO32_11010 [Streptococcus pneumoniae]